MATLTSSNQYKIEKELGEGEFGSNVYLVQTVADPNSRCVVKKYNLSLLFSHLERAADKDRYRAMALEETEKTSRIRHPNIVRVLSTFLEGHNKLYVVMEYCNTGTVKEEIQRRRIIVNYFDEKQVLQWTAQMALTLKFLHDKDLLHRDIKSDNILLVNNMQMIKLGHFGIDNWFVHNYRATHVPPEVSEGKPYQQQSEVWALGMVVYEICALQLPEITTASQSKEAQLPPLPNRFSPELRSLVMDELLERDVSKRLTMVDIIRHPCITSSIVDFVAVIGASPPVTHARSRQCEKPEMTVKPFHDAQYYEKWDQTGKLIFEEAPSSIEAILPCPGSTNCSLVIVCKEGEVIGLQDDGFGNEVLNGYRQRIKLALGENEQIQHAAYDSGNDCIYVKIMSKGKICGFSRQSLRTADGDGVVPCGVVVSEAQAAGRIFECITIDSERRLLYACDNRREITIWQVIEANDVPSATLPNSVLVAWINLSLPTDSINNHQNMLKPQIEPMHCSFFTIKKPSIQEQGEQGGFCPDIYERLRSKLPIENSNDSAPPEDNHCHKHKATCGVHSCDEQYGDAVRSRFYANQDDIFVMAVSDYENNRVEMFLARAKSLQDAIASQIISNRERATHHHHHSLFGQITHLHQHDTTATNVSNLFSHAGSIARISATEKTKLGSVFKPFEVFFDPAGNLVVAEGGNKRIQIFSFDLRVGLTSSPLMSSLPVTLMCPVWVSKPNEFGLGRAAIAVNPKTKKPVAFALDDWKTVFFYDDS